MNTDEMLNKVQQFFPDAVAISISFETVYVKVPTFWGAYFGGWATFKLAGCPRTCKLEREILDKFTEKDWYGTPYDYYGVKKQP